MTTTEAKRTGPTRKRYTLKEWHAEAARRFGNDPDRWRFICPCCKHVASVADWRAAKAPESAIGFSCVGRWVGPKRDAIGLNPPPGLEAAGKGPCNYAGGGLFQLNPVEVEGPEGVQRMFEFAEPDADGD